MLLSGEELYIGARIVYYEQICELLTKGIVLVYEKMVVRKPSCPVGPGRSGVSYMLLPDRKACA